jgi:presenilin-like A22 family membrane protease
MADGASTGRAKTAPEREPADYAGAIYGSLLAASVVAGTSPGKDPPTPRELIALLLSTGVVFWLAHVYAEVVGHRAPGSALTAKDIRLAAAQEWPIVQAAVPPAVAVGVGALFGLSDSLAAWFALLVALVGQMAWALYVAAKARATRMGMLVAGAVNLALGLLIVLLKASLAH